MTIERVMLADWKARFVQKTLVLAAVAAVVVAAGGAQAQAEPAKTPSGIPIERDAVLFKSDRAFLGLTDDMAQMVRLNGYRCDTISSARFMTLERGFVLACNSFAYTYNLRDKGGNWIVSVE